MAWNKKVSSGGGAGEYQLIPSGTHVGTLCGVFDVGTHAETFGGETKDKEKLVAVFQLAKLAPGGKNYVIGERYTHSYNEKANWRGIVEGILGRELDDGEDVDPRELLGKQFLLSIQHTKTGDKTYHNLKSVSPLPEGMPAPQFKATYAYPLVTWGVTDSEPFPREHEGWLPWIYGESIRTIAESSLEVRGRSYRPGPADPAAAYPPPARDTTPAHAMIPAVGDDVPY